MKVLLAVSTVLVVVMVTGGVLGQGGEPPWADEVHADLERGAETHNKWVNRTDPDYPGDRVVENESGTLTVRGEAGGEADYALRTDDELHITDVDRGPAADESFRMFASKPDIEQAMAADNPAAALGEAVRDGDVRVERVVSVGGRDLGLGLAEGLVGLAGVGAGAALLGALGLGTAASLPVLLVSRGTSALRKLLGTLWRLLTALVGVLTKLVTLVTTMEILGFDVRKRIAGATKPLRHHLRRGWRWLRRWVARLDEMQEPADRDRTAGDTGDEGQ